MTTGKQGQLAETACCSYLKQQGLKLLTRNYRCRRGEVDLVMRDGNTLVFVEVRYRKRQSHGLAVETVDQRKQMKLLATVAHYCQRHRIDQPCRIDVVGMHMNDRQKYEYHWIQNAIEAG